MPLLPKPNPGDAPPCPSCLMTEAQLNRALKDVEKWKSVAQTLARQLKSVNTENARLATRCASLEQRDLFWASKQ